MSVTPKLPVPPKTSKREKYASSNGKIATPPVVEETHAEKIERILNGTESLTPEEFELLSDALAEEMLEDCGGQIPVLSDYAISRKGIYVDHD